MLRHRQHQMLSQIAVGSLQTVTVPLSRSNPGSWTVKQQAHGSSAGLGLEAATQAFTSISSEPMTGLCVGLNSCPSLSRAASLDNRPLCRVSPPSRPRWVSCMSTPRMSAALLIFCHEGVTASRGLLLSLPAPLSRCQYLQQSAEVVLKSALIGPGHTNPSRSAS